jgi:eukaryotic translation initiation factor 2C
MFTPCSVGHWMVIIYERQQRFNNQTANQMANDLVKGCEAVGTVTENELAIRAPSP